MNSRIVHSWGNYQNLHYDTVAENQEVRTVVEEKEDTGFEPPLRES